MTDEVNSPSHYNQHGIECIQAIEASMSKEEFQGYLKGNTIKYLWRYRYKGKPKQDLQKALWYLSRLESVTELLPLMTREEADAFAGIPKAPNKPDDIVVPDDPFPAYCETEGHKFERAPGETTYKCICCGALPELQKPTCEHEWTNLVIPGEWKGIYCLKCGAKEEGKRAG